MERASDSALPFDSASQDPNAKGAAPRGRVWKLLLRSFIGLAGGLAVAVIAAHFLGVHPREVWQHIESVPAWATLFGVASSFVVLGLQSWRWHRVMGPLLGLRYTDAFRAQIVGFLFNAFLPARGGDLLRVQYLGRRTGKSRATILGTELVDRWLDWWGWIPTFLALELFAHPPKQLLIALATFGALLSAMGAAMVLLTRAKWKPREGSMAGKLFIALRTGVLAFRDRRIWVTAFFIAPLPWLWEATALTIVGRAFGCDLTLVQAFSVMIAFNVAMIVPSPGGVGTVESGGMLALNFFGFNHSSALAFMTVYHFSQLIPGIAAGAGVLFAEGERLFGGASRLGEYALENEPELGGSAPVDAEALAK